VTGQPAPAWRKSSASNTSGCVEVAFVDQSVLIRDSKHPGGPRLQVPAKEWQRFIDGVRHGEFDLATE